MRYILNDSGYIQAISFNNAMTCNNKSCTEYTGSIPEGYETLAIWSETANINAYKIVDGNLTYDSEEDTRLRTLWATQLSVNSGGTNTNNYSTEEQVIGTWIDGKPIYRKPVLINETVTNAQYIKLTNFNVDTMVNLYSKAKRIDDDREFFGNFYDSTSRKFIIHYTNGEIGIWTDTTENYIATIIVEYTKTTD